MKYLLKNARHPYEISIENSRHPYEMHNEISWGVK
jgi:hypothetical protein